MALALIVCDQVIVEHGTGKKTLVGIFNQVNCRKFPARHPQFSIFVSIHGGKGTYQARITITREAGDVTTPPLISVSGPIKLDMPMHVVEIHFKLGNFVFPDKGIYAVNFLCDDDLIMTRPFMVAEVPPNPQANLPLPTPE